MLAVAAIILTTLLIGGLSVFPAHFHAFFVVARVWRRLSFAHPVPSSTPAGIAIWILFATRKLNNVEGRMTVSGDVFVDGWYLWC